MPMSFRGQEFDIVLCSLGVESDPTLKQMRVLDDQRILDIMLTRARRQTHIFYSFNDDKLPIGHRLRVIYEHAKSITDSEPTGFE